ncbi:hypothetical protein VQ056_14015 [Paenibacillus sp. JTLBN-2024]
MVHIIDVKVSFALTSVPVAPHLEQNTLIFGLCEDFGRKETRICSICGELMMDALIRD